MFSRDIVARGYIFCNYYAKNIPFLTMVLGITRRRFSQPARAGGRAGGRAVRRGNSIVTDVTISETYRPVADKLINTDPCVYLSETLDPYIF